MAGIKFGDIESVDELIAYLKEKQRFSNINYFSKYTALSSVVELFKTEKMFINNPDKMNDLYEYHAFKDFSVWDKICYASFIANGSESIAMWSMYGQPWTDGVMISIPASAFVEVIQNTRYLLKAEYDESTLRYVPGTDLIENEGLMSVVRVAYINGETLTCTGRNDRNSHFKNPYKNVKLAGFIKEAAWEYEKEIRIRVDLPDSYNSKAIYLQLPESLLKQVIITTGPRFEKNVLTSLPQKYRPYIKIRKSKFAEKLAWIPCDTCRNNCVGKQ